MWMTRQDSADFQQEYAIKHKILDARSECNRVEIFKSDAFDEIALINENRIFLRSLLHQESEILAHIPLCTHAAPKRLLIAGGFDLEVAFEALKYEDLEVDFVQEDSKILHSFISFFPHFQEVMKHARCRILSSIPPKGQYDVIIYLSHLKKELVASFQSILSDDGILITRLENLILNIQTMRGYIAEIACDFSIAMPFIAPFSLITDNHFLFLSRHFHPTADIVLQRADMLQNLLNYDATLHQSAFILPRFLKEALKNIAKN